MKYKYLKIIAFITLAITTSCTKEEISKNSNVIIYENQPYATDQTIAKVIEDSTNSIVHFYGDFNENGVPKSITSIKNQRKNSDTIYNYILDENKRIKIAYSELTSGVKISNVIKIDYSSEDKAIVNIYNYDWEIGTDSLLKQYELDFLSDSIDVVYGMRMNQDEIEGMKNALGLTQKELHKLYSYGIAAAGALATIGACAGPQGMTPICPYATLGIWTAVGMLNSAIAKADELTPSDYNLPSAPTSKQYPNPTGTPSTPKGFTFIGEWENFKMVESDGTILNWYSYFKLTPDGRWLKSTDGGNSYYDAGNSYTVSGNTLFLSPNIEYTWRVEGKTLILRQTVPGNPDVGTIDYWTDEYCRRR